MRTIDIQVAQANLFKLLEQAAGGKSFLIAISGMPRVRVLPLDSREAAQLRCFGLPERCLVVAEEFDPSDAADRVDRRKAKRTRVKDPKESVGTRAQGGIDRSDESCHAARGATTR